MSLTSLNWIVHFVDLWYSIEIADSNTYFGPDGLDEVKSVLYVIDRIETREKFV